jgi:hypothetical protein
VSLASASGQWPDNETTKKLFKLLLFLPPCSVISRIVGLGLVFSPLKIGKNNNAHVVSISGR